MDFHPPTPPLQILTPPPPPPLIPREFQAKGVSRGAECTHTKELLANVPSTLWIFTTKTAPSHYAPNPYSSRPGPLWIGYQNIMYAPTPYFSLFFHPPFPSLSMRIKEKCLYITAGSYRLWDNQHRSRTRVRPPGIAHTHYSSSRLMPITALTIPHLVLHCPVHCLFTRKVRHYAWYK